MILTTALRLPAIASASGTTTIVVVDAAGEIKKAQVHGPIPLIDPPDPAYNALPPGALFYGELQIGNTTYKQLYIK